MSKSNASVRAAPAARTESPAKQIAGFVAKFDPATASRIRSARRALRKRLPTAIELVYDNYNFLVFGFCANERASSCIVSLAAAANGVGLSFFYGATLPDPQKILLGSGTQNRFVRLPTAATLTEPAVEALIKAAIKQSKFPLPVSGGGYTLIKSISAKQRPRRAASRA